MVTSGPPQTSPGQIADRRHGGRRRARHYRERKSQRHSRATWATSTHLGATPPACRRALCRTRNLRR